VRSLAAMSPAALDDFVNRGAGRAPELLTISSTDFVRSRAAVTAAALDDFVNEGRGPPRSADDDQDFVALA
jgi:hypothetical protein